VLEYHSCQLYIWTLEFGGDVCGLDHLWTHDREGYLSSWPASQLGMAKTATVSHLRDYESSRMFFSDPCFRMTRGPSSSDFNTSTATCKAVF
jgi:hypothetical protein